MTKLGSSPQSGSVEPYASTWTEEPPPVGFVQKPPWRPGSIAAIGCLLTFGLAGVLFGINWGRLGRRDLVAKTIVLTLVAFVPYTALVVMFGVKGLAFANIGASIAMQRAQSIAYDLHVQNGGKTASIWPAALIGSVMLFIVLAVGGTGWVMYWDARFDEGRTHLEAGRYDEAEKIFVAYAAEFPEEPAVHANLAIVRLKTGRLAEAHASAQKYVDLAPGDQDAVRLLDEIRSAQDSAHSE